MSMPASYQPEDMNPWALRRGAEVMRQRSLEEIIASRTHALETTGMDTDSARQMATQAAMETER